MAAAACNGASARLSGSGSASSFDKYTDRNVATMGAVITFYIR